MSERLKKLVNDALVKLSLPPVDFAVFFTNDLINGDYASNAALVLSKKTGEKPNALTAKIIAEIVKNQPEYLEKIEVAGAGFINFFLSPKFFAAELGRVLQAGDDYGKGQKLNGQKVVVEYTDPNPFKEFHIGHLMSNAIGEATSRLIEASGAEVKRACYQGDVGLHVAEAIWGWQAGEREWGRAYARGSQAHEDKPEARKQIEALNKKIYERSDPELNRLYDEGKRFSLNQFEKIYGRLGTTFDFYFFESESGSFGKKIVEENLGKIFEPSGGAVVFRGEKWGFHTRVFVTKDSLPTYEAKELGLAKMKQEQWPHDLSLVVTGNEVNDYFQVVLVAMKEVLPEEAAKTRHLSHGMLRLPSGKMSSRTGKVITAEALIDEVKQLAREKTEQDDIAEKVAVGAIKYTILKQSPGRDIVFDLNKSVSLAGDSGPYLQYTYVRAKSVLEKSGHEVHPISDLPEAPSELARLIPRFGETAARAAAEYAPQYLVTYLIDLAGAFNSFYAKNQIIGSQEEEYRLILTSAVAQILKSGLWLLGIPAPERM